MQPTAPGDHSRRRRCGGRRATPPCPSGRARSARTRSRNHCPVRPLRHAARCWIRVRIPPGNAVAKLKAKLREPPSSRCERPPARTSTSASARGTATFMILGEVRRCSFCDVAHGRPKPPDADEPRHLAETIRDMGLRCVVITSVDRDDLRATVAPSTASTASVKCAPQPRHPHRDPHAGLPRGAWSALELLALQPPDVFNHNLETVRELYREVRPGADYDWSRSCWRASRRSTRRYRPSGIMLGLGETFAQVEGALNDLRPRGRHGDHRPVPQPTPHHHPVLRYRTPEEFKALEELGYRLGFPASWHRDRCGPPTTPTRWPRRGLRRRGLSRTHCRRDTCASPAPPRPAGHRRRCGCCRPTPPAHPCCSNRPSSRPRRPPGGRVSHALSLQGGAAGRRHVGEDLRHVFPEPRRRPPVLSCSPTSTVSLARTTLDDAILDRDLSVPSPSSTCTSSAWPSGTAYSARAAEEGPRISGKTSPTTTTARRPPGLRPGRAGRPVAQA